MTDAPKRHNPALNRRRHVATPKAGYHDWYQLDIWQRTRQVVLSQEPLCRTCTAYGRLSPTYAIDHITPHRGNWSLFIDRSNLQGLCQSCHNRKSQSERLN